MKQRLEASVQQVRTGSEGIETEIREKLSTAYEWKIKELSFQKEQLEQKLKESGPRPRPEAGGGTSESEIAAEIARTNEQIVEITKFIDDPSSALSNVIRKNVQRSELEAYCRGLAFRSEQALEDTEDGPSHA